jgi:hypothetical protein
MDSLGEGKDKKSYLNVVVFDFENLSNSQNESNDNFDDLPF